MRGPIMTRCGFDPAYLVEPVSVVRGLGLIMRRGGRGYRSHAFFVGVDNLIWG